MTERIDIIEALQRQGWSARDAEADLEAIAEEGRDEALTEGRDEAYTNAHRIALSELHEGHVVVERLKNATSRKKALADIFDAQTKEVHAALAALDEWIASALTAMWTVSWDACNHFNRGPGRDLYDNPSAEVKKRVGEPPIDRLLEAVRKERT